MNDLEFDESPATSGRKSHLRWLAVSIALFGIACVLPAMDFVRTAGPNQNQPVDGGLGIHALLIGWMGVFISQFGWYGNIPLAVGWTLLALRRRAAAAVCGSLSFVIALHTLRLYDQPFAAEQRSDEQVLSSLGPGFWCWLAAMLTIVLGTVVDSRAARRLPQV